MTIQDLVSIVLSRIKIIILFAILGGIAAYFYAEYAMPLKYSTNVKLYVKSSTSVNTSGDANTQELEAAKILAETYIVILNDGSVYERISEKFSEDYDVKTQLAPHIPTITDKKTGELIVSPSYIQSCVSISAVDETEILNISAVTEIPQVAADICDYMAEVAPDVLKRVAKAGSVELIDNAGAKVPNAPVSPNVKKMTVMGIMVGLIGCAAVVILISFFNNKVTTANDLKDKFGVPILAEIPAFDTKLKKGVYKQ